MFICAQLAYSYATTLLSHELMIFCLISRADVLGTHLLPCIPPLIITENSKGSAVLLNRSWWTSALSVILILLEKKKNKSNPDLEYLQKPY